MCPPTGPCQGGFGGHPQGTAGWWHTHKAGWSEDVAVLGQGEGCWHMCQSLAPEVLHKERCKLSAPSAPPRPCPCRVTLLCCPQPLALFPSPRPPKWLVQSPNPFPQAEPVPPVSRRQHPPGQAGSRCPKLQLNPPGTGLHFPHTLQREKPLPSGHPSDNRKYFSPAPRSRGCPGRPLGTPGTSRRAPEGEGSLPAPGSTAPGMELPAPACKSSAPLPSLCG